MTPLGQKVKELRVARGMTQQRLAEKAQVNHSLISAMESGRSKYVSAQDIDALAQGLGVSPNDLWKYVPGGRSDSRYISIVATDAGDSTRAA